MKGNAMLSLLILLLIPAFIVDAWLVMGITSIVMGAFDKPGFGFWASGWLGMLLTVFIGGIVWAFSND